MPRKTHTPPPPPAMVSRRNLLAAAATVFLPARAAGAPADTPHATVAASVAAALPKPPPPLPEPDGFTASAPSEPPAYDLAEFLPYQRDFLTTAIHGGVTPGGGKLAATVDLAVISRRVSSRVTGVNVNQAALGVRRALVRNDETARWNVSAMVRRRIKALGAGITQGHYITLAPRPIEMHPDAVRAIAEELGVAPSYVGATPAYSAVKDNAEEMAARMQDMLDYIWKEKGYNWSRVTTAHEPYAQGADFPAASHAAYHQRVGLAAKQSGYPVKVFCSVHRGVQGSLSAAGRNEYWTLYQMKAGYRHADGFDAHMYEFAKGDPEDPALIAAGATHTEFVLGRNWAMINRTEALCQYIRQLPDGRHRILKWGEWGVGRDHYDAKAQAWVGRNFGLYGARLPGCLHRLVRMIYAARIDNLDDCHLWGLGADLSRDGASNAARPKLGLGQLIPTWDASLTTLSYWAFKSFSDHYGTLAPAVAGSCPFYAGQTADAYHFGAAGPETLSGPRAPMLVTMNEAQTELYVIVVNGDEANSIPVDLTIGPRAFSVVSAIKLESPSNFLTDDPLVDAGGGGMFGDFATRIAQRGSAITWTQPAYSAVFVKLSVPTR